MTSLKSTMPVFITAAILGGSCAVDAVATSPETALRRTGNNPLRATANVTARKKKESQIIYLSGSKVAEVTASGEVWVGGSKVGDITSDGEIWVEGDKEGDLTDDGEVWKAGEKVGEVTKDGEVWRDGNQVGNVEKDGTIWIDGSRDGSFKGGQAARAAVVVFYGFFDLDS